ncbi:NTP transferase domain-containing protein [Enterobacteriaceae bacterium RIT691]|nr:NTP transferase domain-containing protein [Enterobacteriaceae bacterium RIT691]
MVTGIIITAAGRGERFLRSGGSGNKLNAPCGPHSVFSATLASALASGLPVHVVTRPDNTAVHAVCETQQVPYTLLESPGLGDSIAAGVAATPHWSGWLIHLADMPFVPAAVFCQVARLLNAHPVVRPFYLGTPGHPVGFSHTLREALLTLSGDRGAKHLLARFPVYPLESDTVTILQDIDLLSHLPAGA